MTTKALVVLSGGQDSTTCAAIAAHQFDQWHALTVNYGQRHAIELDAATAVAKALGAKSHETIELGQVLKSSSPLVSGNPVGQYAGADELPGGIEPTFVPGRNLLFMVLAANRAAALDCSHIYMGLCQEDYGGYPDCRQDFVDVMEAAISEGFYCGQARFDFVTPLMDLTKAESVELALDVLGDRFNEIMGLSHTCYNGVKGGCGKCHACILRDRGFREAGVDDPLWRYRSVVA
ncbi:MAG: 7-cyano-7-deazaguanine synthase QueC [Cyanobacteria bacterium J06607_13]